MGRPRTVPEGTTHWSCRTCDTVKLWDEEHFFKTAEGRCGTECKSCHKQRSTEWAKANPKRHRELTSASYRRHPETQEAAKRRRRERYADDPLFRERTLDGAQAWRGRQDETFKARARAKRKTPHGRLVYNTYQRAHRKESPQAKIAHAYRNRLREVIKLSGSAKTKRSFDYLGCDASFLRLWIEMQFELGMTWQNYGYGHDRWHIDHWFPVSCFNLTDPERLRVAFHWTNLRPLWQTANLSKGSSVPETDYQI